MCAPSNMVSAQSSNQIIGMPRSGQMVSYHWTALASQNEASQGEEEELKLENSELLISSSCHRHKKNVVTVGGMSDIPCILK